MRSTQPDQRQGQQGLNMSQLGSLVPLQQISGQNNQVYLVNPQVVIVPNQQQPI